MADQKITQLDELTTPALEDLLAIVDDPSGTPITKKATLTNLLKVYADGWTPVSDSWSYASADEPTFTITVPSGAALIYGVGDRIKLTQTTVKYFIVTAVADTVLTVYGGTDYELADAEISAISYSHQKAPLGFPLSPVKWTVTTTDTGDRTQASPTQNTWYNLGSVTISVPIGLWRTVMKVVPYAQKAGATGLNVFATLSTANNSESNSKMTGYALVGGASGTLEVSSIMQVEDTQLIASKTSMYLNVRTTTASAGSIYIFGSIATPTIIRAICAYL